ncbi:unnamed protein product [Hapterophycus canaliculatus]
MNLATTSLPGSKRSIDTLTLPNKTKKVATAGLPVAAFARATPPSAPASSPAAERPVAHERCAFTALPTVVIGRVGSLLAESSLSVACRSTLEALPEVHYKINMSEDVKHFEGDPDPLGVAARDHFGLHASGRLATGRVVVRITITHVALQAYFAQQQAVKRVVRHSITTLQEITISSCTGPGNVPLAHILGELVPRSAKRRRVAPRLAKVHLVAGATGVAKAGKAVAAGLWPALEVLTFSHCRANAGHFKDLASGLSARLAPRLRVLYWGDQSSIRKNPIDDVVLTALSRGGCPLIEHLSFTGNHFCPEKRIECLLGALRACPLLRTLRMDCSRTPHLELRDLARALEAGHAPNLELLFVRATTRYYRGSDVQLKALRRAAASRKPPVELESEIKTRLKD